MTVGASSLSVIVSVVDVMAKVSAVPETVTVSSSSSTSVSSVPAKLNVFVPVSMVAGMVTVKSMTSV